MVREPGISGRRIAILLKKNKDFIIKRKRKVDRANRENVSRSSIEKEVGELENMYRAMALDLYAIITSGESEKTQIMAFNALWKARRDLIDTKMDAGIFKRELGKIEVEGDLSSEQIAKMNDAIDKLYGIKQRGTKRGAKNKKGKAKVDKA